MRYLSVAEITRLWGISARGVRSYCAQGRVPGAFLTGKTWSIPADARKPTRLNGRRVAPTPLLARLREEMSARTSGGIYHKVQVELTYNSSHMEGSRLTRDQTRLIFETSTISPQGEGVRVDHIISHAGEALSESLLKDLHRTLKASTSDSGRDWFAVGDYKLLPNEVGGRETTAPENVAREVRGLISSYEANRAPTLEDIVSFHVSFERIHPFQDGNGRVGRLVMFKECLRHGIVPFVIGDDTKFFYYRGLSRWDVERGWLMGTCLSAQDSFKGWLDYYRIPYSG